MNSALNLGKQGFEVVLVEKEPVLGGFALNLRHTIEGADVQAYLEKLIAEVDSPRQSRDRHRGQGDRVRRLQGQF